MTHLSLAAVHPKTQGFNHHADLIDPHNITPNAIEVLPHNWETMVVAKEAMGEGVVVVGILPIGKITKTMGLTMTWGATSTLMMWVTPIAVGEIQGTGLNQDHMLSRVTPMTW